MGCVGSSEANRSVEIQVALVGSGGSGKTTLVKQWRIIHGAFNIDTELENIRYIFEYNIFEGLTDLVEFLEEKEIKDKENRKFANEILETKTYKEFKSWDGDTVKRIQALWKDPGVQNFVKSYDIKKIDMEYNLVYIINNIERLAKDDCEITEMDILMARQRTTGLDYSTFTTPKPYVKWKFIDAGGQPTEIKKWQYALEKSQVVIFTVGLDDFNVSSYWDKSKTIMDESLELFRKVVDEDSEDRVVLLFLNKTDLFEEKLGHLKKTFKEYEGGRRLTPAIEYISSRYLKMPKKATEVFVHPTCALNKADMGAVFEKVKQLVIKKRLQQSNLLKSSESS